MSPKSETPRTITDGSDAEGLPTATVRVVSAKEDAASTVAPVPAVEAAKQTVTTPTGEAVPMAIVKVVGLEDIERIFTYHKPDAKQLAVLEHNRIGIKELARQIITTLPPSRERGLAITHLEQAMFWANSAVVRGN
jgi:hypothetical protein